MFLVIVRTTSHHSDDESHERRPYMSSWVRAHGKAQDTNDQAAAQTMADRINSWPPDRGQFCRHWEARVVSTSAGEFNAPPVALRMELERLGIWQYNPGPAGRIIR